MARAGPGGVRAGLREARPGSRPRGARRLTVIPDRPGRLSPAEKTLLFGELLVAYARSRWLLSRSDLPSALAQLRMPLNASVPPATDDVALVSDRLGGAVSRAFSAVPMDATCLIRSLVLSAVLARRNIPFELVIGVKPGDEFCAHAWVERDGEALLPHEGYSRLHSL